MIADLYIPKNAQDCEYPRMNPDFRLSFRMGGHDERRRIRRH